MKLAFVVASIAAIAAGVFANDVAVNVDSTAITVNEHGEEIIVDPETGLTQTLVDGDAGAALARNMAEAEKLADPTTPETVLAAMPLEGKTYPYALLLLENSCKLRNHFTGAREFAGDELNSYPNLSHRFVGGLPRFRFFEDKADLEINTVDTNKMNAAELTQMLNNLSVDPNYYQPKKSYVDVPLSKATSSQDIKDLLERFGVQRSFTPDESRVFTIQETADEPSGRDSPSFDLDEMLNELENSANGTVVSEGEKISHDEL